VLRRYSGDIDMGRLVGAGATITLIGLAALAGPAWAEPEEPEPPSPAGVSGSPTADSGLVTGTPCTLATKACVDLVTQQAWLIQNGAVIRGPVPITSGGPGEETPQGDFKVQWKDQNHISDNQAHTPMPYSVFFAPGGVALHGGSLYRASAGCVHLAEPDAIAFYEGLKRGDRVEVRAPSDEVAPPPLYPNAPRYPSAQRDSERARRDPERAQRDPKRARPEGVARRRPAPPPPTTAPGHGADGADGADETKGHGGLGPAGRDLLAQSGW